MSVHRRTFWYILLSARLVNTVQRSCVRFAFVRGTITDRRRLHDYTSIQCYGNNSGALTTIGSTRRGLLHIDAFGWTRDYLDRWRMTFEIRNQWKAWGGHRTIAAWSIGSLEYEALATLDKELLTRIPDGIIGLIILVDLKHTCKCEREREIQTTILHYHLILLVLAESFVYTRHCRKTWR